MVRALVSMGCDLNCQDSVGRSPALWAASWGHWLLVVLLGKAGADLALCSYDGDTVLHWAASSGEEMVVEYVLQEVGAKGAVAVGSGGLAALHLAAEAGHEAVARLLLRSGADPEQADLAGDTPLHAAARAGHAFIASALIERMGALGINVASMNDEGCTAMDLAGRHGHEAVAMALFAARCPRALSPDRELPWPKWCAEKGFARMAASLAPAPAAGRAAAAAAVPEHIMVSEESQPQPSPRRASAPRSRGAVKPLRLPSSSEQAPAAGGASAPSARAHEAVTMMAKLSARAITPRKPKATPSTPSSSAAGPPSIFAGHMTRRDIDAVPTVTARSSSSSSYAESLAQELMGLELGGEAGDDQFGALADIESTDQLLADLTGAAVEILICRDSMLTQPIGQIAANEGTSVRDVRRFIQEQLGFDPGFQCTCSGVNLAEGEKRTLLNLVADPDVIVVVGRRGNE
jgi:hypothetical protein